jgi:tetratricopeptide (TPR) repeat protein
VSTKTKSKLKAHPAAVKRSVAPAGSVAAPTWQVAALGAVLMIATLVLYSPLSSHPFINYDDPVYVTENAHVQAGLTGETVRWAFTTFEFANWHPLTWLSHALDYQLFQLDAGSHHEMSAFLHALNAVLLLLVLYRATGALGASVMVAALFAFHPVNVESVAWASERKNVLSALFFILGLGAYRWYTREPRATRYSVVALLFACGLMAKPQVITFPFVLLLWDYWPLRRIFPEKDSVLEEEKSPVPARSLSWLLLEKVPLFALCAADAILTIQAEHTTGGTAGEAHALVSRLGNAIYSYWRYIANAFWPSKLALFYPYAGDSLGWVQIAGAALLLVAVTVFVVVFRRHRYLPVGWFWFLGILVPVIGIMQVGIQSMADRYAYLAFVGLFIMVCWGVADLARQLHVPSKYVAGAGVAVLLMLAFAAHTQIGYWQDSVSIWSHTVEVTEKNYLAEGNLGGALLADGAMEQAMPHFYKALTLNPDDPESNLNVGSYEQQNQNLPQAIAQFKKVISVTQDSVVRNRVIRSKAFNNLGYAYRGQGDLQDARVSFQQAIALNPQYVRAWTGLGLVYAKTGDFKAAEQAWSTAVQLQPTDWGYILLARAMEHNGDVRGAQTMMQQAKAMSRNVDNAQRMADQLLAQ